MLVISRKPGETFTISGGITIKIVGSSSKRVRVGIDAPPEIQVCRDDAKDKGPDHDEESEAAA